MLFAGTPLTSVAKMTACIAIHSGNRGYLTFFPAGGREGARSVRSDHRMPQAMIVPFAPSMRCTSTRGTQTPSPPQPGASSPG